MELNFDLNKFIDDFSVSCKKHQKKTFVKNEIITYFIKNRNQMCVLLSGHADLVRYDLNGNKTIVEHFSGHDVFGEVFYNINTNNELFVEAKTQCVAILFSYDSIYNSNCKEGCSFHDELRNAFPSITLHMVKEINTRLELLTLHSTRDKLIGYFSLVSSKSLSKSFTLDFSLTDLADYLSVDRSAMMRELSALKAEGFIEKSGNRITLLHK